MISAPIARTAAGFQIIATDYHDGFGKREKGETWELVFAR
jgi:hypothetical protein